MTQLEQYFSDLIKEAVYKLIISKPRKKDSEYKKIVVERMVFIRLPNTPKSRYSMKMWRFQILP